MPPPVVRRQRTAARIKLASINLTGGGADITAVTTAVTTAGIAAAAVAHLDVQRACGEVDGDGVT